jgi:thiol-disulfide isomerase/thioredoxin
MPLGYSLSAGCVITLEDMMITPKMKKDSAPIKFLRKVSVLMMTMALAVSGAAAADTYWIGKPAPELAAGEWINSKPLSLKGLHGKVVLLEFWTFGCYNSLNTLPHIKAWHRKYAGAEFEIIGVHTPEFDREKDLKGVKREVARHGVAYPVLTDNDYTTWNRYNQQYWPVVYLLDKQGIIRYIHIGEGNYEETERQIGSLIGEK